MKQRLTRVQVAAWSVLLLTVVAYRKHFGSSLGIVTPVLRKHDRSCRVWHVVGRRGG